VSRLVVTENLTKKVIDQGTKDLIDRLLLEKKFPWLELFLGALLKSQNLATKKKYVNDIMPRSQKRQVYKAQGKN